MNNIIKGYQYEIFINDYLNSNNNIKISYLWKDIPEDILFTYGFINSIHDTRLNRKTNNINKLEDIGTDIIYINQNDECIIVQCKNYESKNICVKDLSGFSFLFLISKVPIKGIIISHTECSQLVQSIFLNNDKIKYQKLE